MSKNVEHSLLHSSPRFSGQKSAQKVQFESDFSAYYIDFAVKLSIDLLN